MINLSGLYEQSNTLTRVSSIALVTPRYEGYKAQYGRGKDMWLGAPLLFHIEDDNMVNLQSDITDHVVEDNTVVNDQISLKPETVTVRGLIGELYQFYGEELFELKQARDRLILVDAYVPELTAGAIRVLNEAESAYRLAQNLKRDMNASLTSSEIQNNQQTYFQRFYDYWRERNLFTVQTPWQVFDDMAIQSLRAVQGEDTNQVTDFEITFKKIRFARTVLKQLELNGRLDSQGSSKKNNGVQGGKEVSMTIGEFL